MTGADAVTTLRLKLRVPTFSTGTVMLAVGAHLAGGGGLPGGTTLALLAATVAAVAAPLATKRRGLPALTAGVLTVQLGVHLALSQSSAMAQMTDHDASRVSSSPAMTAAHTVAALALAWWLHRGEDRIWAAIDRVATALFGRPASAPRLLLVTGLTAARQLLPALRYTGSISLVRGPPAH